MTDDYKKVVRIFGDSKKKSSEIQKDEKGIYFVRAEKDENGNFFNDKHLINFANNTDYLIRVMKIEDDKTCVYTYRISGDMLVSFIANYSDSSTTERIIEITKCQPQNLA
jgi:hypothetical protein